MSKRQFDGGEDIIGIIRHQCTVDTYTVRQVHTVSLRSVDCRYRLNTGIADGPFIYTAVVRKSSKYGLTFGGGLCLCDLLTLNWCICNVILTYA